MSSLLPCPVVCQPAPTRPSVLRAGVSLLKLNKWKLPQARFLWLDVESMELRWSKNSRLAAASYKRLPFALIQKVSKLSKYRQMRAEHGFTIDTAEKTYIFRTETVEMRDRLVSGLVECTKKDDRWSLRSLPCNLQPVFEDTENCITPERKPSDVSPLRDSNKPESLICSRELFSKTNSASRKPAHPEESYRNILSQISLAVSHRPNPNVSQSPYFEDLPETVARIIEAQQVHIRKLREDLLRETTENGKIQGMRKRLRMLEAAKEELEAIEGQNEDLKEKFASQLETTLKLEEQLSTLLPQTPLPAPPQASPLDSEESLIQANFDLLRKGFHGYICCFADEIVSKQICLSPKRIGDDPSYKKRHIFCSPDLAQLIWKPISLFSNRRVFICISEVSSVLSGTENPEMQPFSDYEYLTVLSPQITMVIAVEKQFGFYLEGIKALFARSNGFPFSIGGQDADLLSKYKTASQHYDSQLRQLDRQIKRYKNTLTDSICNVSTAPQNVHAIYQSEIESLRGLNEKCVSSLISPEAEYYLLSEKSELLSHLSTLTSLLATLQSPL